MNHKNDSLEGKKKGSAVCSAVLHADILDRTVPEIQNYGQLSWQYRIRSYLYVEGKVAT